MVAGRRSWLVAAVLAALVTIGDVGGWWYWHCWTRLAAVHPAAAAEKLGSGILLTLPATVQRSHSLALGSLTGVGRPALAQGLERLGSLQLLWCPAHSAGMANRARSRLLTGDLETARGLLDEAVDRDPSSPLLRRFRASVAMARGHKEFAFQELAIAEAIAPGFRHPPVELTEVQELELKTRGHELRGDYYPRRRIENALVLARTLRREATDQVSARRVLEPLAEDPRVKLELAAWAVEDGQAERALQVVNEVVDSTVYPRSLRSRGLAIKALALEMLGDTRGALGAAEQAVRLDPSGPEPYMALARIAERRGDYDAALDHLRRARGVAPTDLRVLAQIAATADRGGKADDAIAALERAVEISPGDARLAGRLVALQLRQDRLTDAAFTLSRALDRHPTDGALLRLSDELRRRVKPR